MSVIKTEEAKNVYSQADQEKANNEAAEVVKKIDVLLKEAGFILDPFLTIYTNEAPKPGIRLLKIEKKHDTDK